MHFGWVRRRIPLWAKKPVKAMLGYAKPLMAVLHRVTLTQINLVRRRGKENRKLEIGPGPKRIDGFETLNIVPGANVDYVADAGKRLPFPDETFDVVYASHVLEHIPWFDTEKVLREWRRVLKVGGVLQIWVPDGLKICKAFVEAEFLGHDPFEDDPWERFNEEKEVCKWAAGRIFTYGDGTSNPSSPNWHRALFSERYLCHLLQAIGLTEIRQLDHSEVRGQDHGWINLGVTGRKRDDDQLFKEKR